MHKYDDEVLENLRNIEKKIEQALAIAEAQRETLATIALQLRYLQIRAYTGKPIQPEDLEGYITSILTICS